MRKKLREARIEKGYTQAKIAWLIGLTPNYYCALENGNLPLTRTTWWALRNFLDLPGKYEDYV